jgi:hypothetical protein
LSTLARRARLTPPRITLPFEIRKPCAARAQILFKPYPEHEPCQFAGLVNTRPEPGGHHEFPLEARRTLI